MNTNPFACCRHSESGQLQSSSHKKRRVVPAGEGARTIATRQLIRSGHSSNGINCICEVGPWVVSGCADSTFKVWDPRDQWSCAQTVHAHDGDVCTMIQCEILGSWLLVTGAADGMVKVWDVASWTCVQTLLAQTEYSDSGEEPRDRDVSALLWHQDQLISCGDDNMIRVWNTVSWQCDHVAHTEHTGGINSLVRLDEELVCTGGGTDDGTIRVWRAENWSCVGVIRGHADAVQCLLVWGGKLLSASDDHTIKLWEMGGGGEHTELLCRCKRTLQQHGDGIYSIVMCGERLVSCSADRSVREWNTKTWKCTNVMEMHTDAVTALLCMKDESTCISAGYDGNICVMY